MSILPSEYTDEQVGLEAPAEASVACAPGESCGAPASGVACPNCGGSNATAHQVEELSVSICSDCNCEFCASSEEADMAEPVEPEAAPEAALTVESKRLNRILGKVFETHAKHMARAKTLK